MRGAGILYNTARNILKGIGLHGRHGVVLQFSHKSHTIAIFAVVIIRVF
jgi:hypothetical protein